MPTTNEQNKTLPDPFSPEGAKRISQLAGQALAPQAMPLDVSTLTSSPTISTPTLPTAPLPDISSLTLSLGDTARQTELRQERDAIVGDITDTNAKLATKNARKAELETAQGLPALNQQLNEINTQIRGIQNEALKATETSENRLAPTFAIQGEQAQIDRQRAVRTFGLAATSEAIQGNIALANDHVARALDAEFGGLEQEIENKKFLLDLNMENFNAEEKRRAEALQLQLDEEQKKIAQAREDKATTLDIMLEAAKNGADNSTLNRIQLSTSPEAAVRAAGTYLVPPKVTGSSSVGSSGSGTRTSGDLIPSDTPDYLIEVMRGSKGGKALTGDQTTPLTKASIVLNQVADLATTIQSTNTDPILGILRDKNPYDVKARLISAQLRATVPNLARGIYGEVGVLTDTDIANYIQTLPNIRTPEEANALVLSMTLRTIINSMGAQLESLAASGRDVSGYENIYARMKQLADSLTPASTDAAPDLSQYENAPSTRAASAPGAWQPTSTSDYGGNFFSRAWQGFKSFFTGN